MGLRGVNNYYVPDEMCMAKLQTDRQKGKSRQQYRAICTHCNTVAANVKFEQVELYQSLHLVVISAHKVQVIWAHAHELRDSL